jgi:hypothetical protein
MRTSLKPSRSQPKEASSKARRAQTQNFPCALLYSFGKSGGNECTKGIFLTLLRGFSTARWFESCARATANKQHWNFRGYEATYSLALALLEAQLEGPNG